MAIPESQLETWCNQGATVTSSAAYTSIKAALGDPKSKVRDLNTEIYLQGSYGNTTNIYADSDVDVVVQFNSVYSWDVSSLARRSSTMGFYSAYYELSKHVLWRPPIMQKWGGVKVPVLIGSWKGHVITSFDEAKGKHPVEATIVQNWTEIQISMKSAYSKSHSIVGSILISEDETVIDYEYKNEPLATAIGTMHAHRGTASLVLSAGGHTLSGDYYSGRDRQNFGSLHLEKQKAPDSARTKQK
jgi:hypothetical protein